MNANLFEGRIDLLDTDARPIDVRRRANVARAVPFLCTNQIDPSALDLMDERAG